MMGMSDNRIEARTSEMGHGGMDLTMRKMRQSLEGKHDDRFDQAFIEAMIEHHEGAIEMAELALISAEHDEIKELSRAIIDAQTSEIIDMRDWARQWGYELTD